MNKKTDWNTEDEIENAMFMVNGIAKVGGELGVFARQLGNLLKLHRQNIRTIQSLRKRNRYLAKQIYDGECKVRDAAPAKEEKPARPAEPLSWTERTANRTKPHDYVAPRTNATVDCEMCGLYPGATIHKPEARQPHKFMASSVHTHCVICNMEKNASVHEYEPPADYSTSHSSQCHCAACRERKSKLSPPANVAAGRNFPIA